MSKLLWKSMKAGMKSNHGRVKWKVGEWQKKKSRVKLCDKGFHASERVIDAMQYVNMEVLARVEVRGESDIQKDKQAWSEMKIVKAYSWKKEDSVALAIYAAELVIDNFEKKFPEDKRPREAIEAAKKWLKNPTEENRTSAQLAAWSARSAELAAELAARSAELAAWSAARSAQLAARSAQLAAWSAAQSARSAQLAARSAELAAQSAVWSAESAELAAEYENILDKIEQWILKRVKTLEEYKED